MLCIEKGDIVHSKGGLSPRKIYEITVADTVDRSSGRIDVIDILNRSISSVKRTPAKGAYVFTNAEETVSISFAIDNGELKYIAFD